MYFERTADKTSDKDIYTAKLIPSRGAWLEFEIDKRDMVGVRLDRKRKQNVTVLLKALQAIAEDTGEAYDYDAVMADLRQYESIQLTEEKDNTSGPDDALLDIYRKLRPGEPPTREAALTLLKNYYFNPKRYDLAKVGRYKVNKKLGQHEAFDQQTMTIADMVATIKYIVQLHNGDEFVTAIGGEIRKDADGKDLPVSADDIDHFGNRRMRTVGELIQNQLRTGLARMERVVRERMTTQDVEAITPQSLINIRPVVAALKEFFGTSQLSQFMDQTNPIAGLTHKRRLSALGPGGLSRDRAGMEVRDVHPSHYGRMCPIETPEGPNIGLIGSLASYGRINRSASWRPPPTARSRAARSPTRSTTSPPTTRTATSSPRRTRRSTRTTSSSRTACWSASATARSPRSRPTRSTTWTSRRARWCRSRPP